MDEVEVADAWPQCLSFDDVRGACSKERKDGGRVDVVSVGEFLREAGCNGKRVLERVDTWTGEGSKLGLVKNNHFAKQRWHGGCGSREQWSASKATLRKVWKVLRK